MTFKDLNLLKTYKTYKNNIITEFYTPVLKEAVLYQRAVGFFSSTALIDLMQGITGLIKNNGKIQFIVSPRLTKEDIEAINKGYEKKKIISEAMLRDFYEPQNYFQEMRLNYLAYLIEMDYLDIKVAFTPPNKELGMYHEKVGIVTDKEGNKVVFTGSLNETINAFYNNYESIVVFTSWETTKDYANEMQRDFDILWNNQDKNLEVFEFPKVLKEKFQTFRKPHLPIDGGNIKEDEGDYLYTLKKGIPRLPKDFKLRKYQIEAIENWKSKNYRGIFDMATGTGKTYTGLGAIVNLYESKNRLAIIIVCPYQHLVEQWVEDIIKFNMLPTIGYSSSPQKDWKRRLSSDIMDFKLKVINSFCFVTTNATYSTDYVQKELNKLGEDTLLVVDEAHNFGAEHLQKKLNTKIPYRLALSATLERHGDEAGTKALYDYFGEKCIEYNLELAIKEKKLTPYFYYPVIVYLTTGELDKYREISRRIIKFCHKDNNGKFQISDTGKRLLIERARIVAGASNKVAKLKELMLKYREDTHILIYCGAARNNDFSQDVSERDEDGERQIVSVSKMLGLELGMKVTHFTSSESSKEREKIKRQFANADPYQAIVAIKCLDEGVNIPSIKTAFILASSTNPKEYIQRRGRVLRTFEGKAFATIYDFITLPVPLEYVNCGSENARFDLSLVRKEILRMNEFGRISKNPSDADKLIKELSEVYGLDTLNEEEFFDE